MIFLLSKSDELGWAIGLAVAAIVGGGVWLASWLNAKPTTLAQRMLHFFGKSFATLQPHDKQFPGYDLASVSRALESVFAEFAASREDVGSIQLKSAQQLTAMDPDTYEGKAKPSPPTFERLPVDVDVEESFVSNCLYFVVLRPDALPGGGASLAPDDPRLKIAILLSHIQPYAPYEEMDAQSAKPAHLDVGIACQSRDVADFFFAQIEERRRRLSVYRGKVIDPHVTDGGIQTIGFRRIHRVGESDLILPQSVKALTHGAIVSFYRHGDALRSLGVELKRGILFHSPPGTGKTSISLYLAGMLPNFTVCFVSGRRLLYPREVCGMARYLQPTMLVFEDIDLIAQERDMNGLATVLGELMNQIDGCEPNEQVLFVMNTNSMDRIEQAVKNRPGRIDQIIHIPLPDLADRRRLLHLFTARFAPPADEIDRVAAATDGATPAMLKEIVKRAAVSAVARASGEIPGGVPGRNGDATGNGDGDGNGDENGDGEQSQAKGDGRTQAPPGIVITAQDLLLAYEQVQYMRGLKSPVTQIL